MIMIGSIPWCDVRPGVTVVLPGDVPRTVLACDSGWLHDRIVFLEGIAALTVRNDDPVFVVALDTNDAIGNLFAAGLGPEPIQER